MSKSSSRRNFLSAGLAVPALLPAHHLLPEKPATTEPVAGPAAKLDYRTLGKTGLKVTTLGFGAMITSDGSVLERAADLGVNYFDTARGYQNGNCERMVGAALKSRRKQLYISTKSHARTKESALSELDTSLRELQTDYVDIWYLHAMERASDFTDELIEAQVQAQKAGKIRFAGFSCHTGHKEVVAAALARKHFDVTLLSYNFSMGSSLDEVVHSAAADGLGVVAMKVMAGGMRGPTKPENEKTRAILKREGAMLAALKWALNNPNVHTTIPSMTDMDQLDENRGAMAQSYSDTDGKLLAAHLERISPEICRLCNECVGQCRYGLPVPDLNRFLMYGENYGEFAMGREHFLALPASVRNVRCGDCSECTVECPYGVRVRQRLSRTQEMYA